MQLCSSWQDVDWRKAELVGTLGANVFYNEACDRDWQTGIIVPRMDKEHPPIAVVHYARQEDNFKLNTEAWHAGIWWKTGPVHFC